MAKKHTMKGVHFESFEIETNGHTWIVDKNAQLVSEQQTIDIEGNNNTFIIAGTIWGEDQAVGIGGSGNKILITRSGTLSGDDASALQFIEADNQATNLGSILSGEIAVEFDEGSGHRFTNKVLVSGDIGVSYDVGFVAPSPSVVVNKATGTIYGDQAAIDSLVVSGDTFKLINQGRIVSDGMAYEGFDGRDVIVNKGSMTGDVNLGLDDDSFDGRGGELNGVLNGGGGNDTLLTDNDALVLGEQTGQGFDTVRSTASYTLTAFVEQLILIGAKNINGTGTDGIEWFYGNSGKNVLDGKGGTDLMDAGAGNDKIWTGLDDDTIVFGTGYGTDIVQDFENGADQVNLAKWNAISDFTDLLDNHTVFEDGDVIISAGKDKLIIRNLSEAQFDTNDVSFIAV